MSCMKTKMMNLWNITPYKDIFPLDDWILILLWFASIFYSPLSSNNPTISSNNKRFLSQSIYEGRAEYADVYGFCVFHLEDASSVLTSQFHSFSLLLSLFLRFAILFLINQKIAWILKKLDKINNEKWGNEALSHYVFLSPALSLSFPFFYS